MLKFATILPHPPIVIPEIGNKSDHKIIKKTYDSMNKIAKFIEEKEIETLIIISPHGLIYPDRFTIPYYDKLEGNFSQFNHPEIISHHLSDRLLAKKIQTNSLDNNINCQLLNHGSDIGEFDHGCLVPLYFIDKTVGSKLKVLPIYYSGLSSQDHFNFGKIIAQTIKQSELSKENIGIIASGDLAHRLFDQDNKVAKYFDKQIIQDLKDKQIMEILQYDQQLLEQAGECGYRSIITLLGVLDESHYNPEILSYEGPYGVGYGVINFKLDR